MADSARERERLQARQAAIEHDLRARLASGAWIAAWSRAPAGAAHAAAHHLRGPGAARAALRAGRPGPPVARGARRRPRAAAIADRRGRHRQRRLRCLQLGARADRRRHHLRRGGGVGLAALGLHGAIDPGARPRDPRAAPHGMLGRPVLAKPADQEFHLVGRGPGQEAGRAVDPADQPGPLRLQRQGRRPGQCPVGRRTVAPPRHPVRQPVPESGSGLSSKP